MSAIIDLSSERLGCPRCGSATDWVNCEACDEYGMDGHDCGEDSCCCLHPEDNVACQMCGGHGGWVECPCGLEKPEDGT